MEKKCENCKEESVQDRDICEKCVDKVLDQSNKE